MLEDKLLVIKCKRGNKDAMCRLYEKYKDYLLTLAKALLGEQADAEDIVHDVFVTFARSAGKFRLTGNLKGYLAACVSNRARDRIRARVRHAEALDSASPFVAGPRNPEQQAAEQRN